MSKTNQHSWAVGRNFPAAAMLTTLGGWNREIDGQASQHSTAAAEGGWNLCSGFDVPWPGAAAGENGIVRLQSPRRTKENYLAKQHSTKQQQRKVVAKFTVEKFWITKCSFLVSSQRSAPCQPLDSQKTTAEELHTHLFLVFKGISHSSFCEPSVKHTSLVSWVAES